MDVLPWRYCGLYYYMDSTLPSGDRLFSFPSYVHHVDHLLSHFLSRHVGCTCDALRKALLIQKSFFPPEC